MKYFWKPFVWFAIITILSLIPGDDLPQEQIFIIPHFDKIVHVGMYFVCCLFLISPFEKIKLGNGYFAAFSTSLLIGAIFELLQSTITRNRSGNIEDFIADLIGATLALIFYRYFILGKKIEIIFKAQ